MKSSKFDAIAGAAAKGPAEIPAPKATRADGKRSDPRYRQLTAYVTLESFRLFKMDLMANRNGCEISEAIQDVLDHWPDVIAAIDAAKAKTGRRRKRAD